MVENLDEHGHEPPHESHQDDDFPADFFDDEPEPTHGEPAHPLPPGEAVIAADPNLPAEPDLIAEPEEVPATPLTRIPPTLRPGPTAAAAADAPVPHPALPIIVGTLLVGTLAAAIAFNMRGTEAASPAPTTAATPAPTPTEPQKADPLAEVSNEIKTLQTQVASLMTQVEGLQDQIEEMPKAAPPPDLKPIETKIAEVARTTAGVAPLPKKVDDLQERVGAVDKTLGTLRDELASIRDDVKKANEQAAAAVAAASASSAKPETAATISTGAAGGLDDGAKLFKAGKYKEADDLFRKLTDSKPDDARVWYFAALSHGAATNLWTGETERLVRQGIEREKAGTPEVAKINSTFNDLAPSLKPWLDGYRKFATR